MTTVSRGWTWATALTLVLSLPVIGGDVLVTAHVTDTLARLVSLLA